MSSLGFVAAVSRHAQIGSSILPLYTRTPSVLAMTAVGLDKLSAGRFILGLGASGPQVIEGFHGVPYDAPLARTAEIIEICRSVWRRDRLEHHGRMYDIPLPAGKGTGLGKPLKLIDHPVRDRIPVYIASLGPKNVELTAAIADGWLPLHFWPDRAERAWGDALRAGRARREPDLAPLQVVAGGPLAIGADVEHLRELARPHLALYFGGMGARGRNFYNDVLRRYGYEQVAVGSCRTRISAATRPRVTAAMVPAEARGRDLAGRHRGGAFVRGPDRRLPRGRRHYPQCAAGRAQWHRRRRDRGRLAVLAGQRS